MNQIMIGNFLRELRNEKGITQEQAAEQFGVAQRTVSRWETGHNMPDINMLIELSEYYDVDVQEIIYGERKSEKMKGEMKETLEGLAEYSNAEKTKVKKNMINVSISAAVTLIIAEIISRMGLLSDHVSKNIMISTIVFSLLILVLNVFYLSGGNNAKRG